MNILNKKQRIIVLVNLLNKANVAYYTSGNPIMTDDMWNDYFEELKSLEKETGYILSGSPTQYAGYRIVDKIDKVVHTFPMLSLNKIHTVDEIKKFVNNKDCICSLKMDGLTIRATYLNGELDKLETRGNGEIGSDITYHKKSFLNIPLHIEKKGKYIIDGECIIKTDDFERINKQSDVKFENPRNLAAGTLSTLDTSISSKRYLRFIAWNVIEDVDQTNSFSMNLKNANKLGFTVVPWQPINNNSDLETILDNVKKLASNFDYPIDGAVFSYDDIAYGMSLGNTTHHFNHSVAYKYNDEKYKTTLKDIVWSMGTDKLTPVAIFNPVRIDGSTVEKASLHNISYIKKLKLGIGDNISVYLANMIIPQISENFTQSNTFEIPTTCPYCGMPTEIREDGIAEGLYCVNPYCQAKLESKCERFVSKPCMNIDGLSKATLKIFIQKGWIKHPFDIYYHLYDFKKDMMELDGFGTKSVNKLFMAIEKSRQITLNRFINAMNIPMVGKTTAKLISEKCHNDIKDFIKKCQNEFDWTQIDTIGDTINQSIHTWYKKYNQEVRDFIDNCLIFETPIEDKGENKLEGKSICITGKLEKYSNRNALVSDIEKYGGNICSGVTKKTDYLLTNDTTSGSSKNKKAKELNILIITEEEFITMIGGLENAKL